MLRLPRLAARDTQYTDTRDSRRRIRQRGDRLMSRSSQSRTEQNRLGGPSFHDERAGEPSRPVGGQPNRLATIGFVNRSRPLSFKFDGKSYRGFPGDTLASALLAAGVDRRAVLQISSAAGILTAGSEEPNALVELRSGARREPKRARPWRNSTRGLRRKARTVGHPRLRLRGDKLLVLAVLRRRLLLQNLYVAGIILGEALRAGDPARRRPRQRQPGA